MLPSYEKVLIESITHKLKIPTKEQYNRNSYYYNNRLKRINEKNRNYIMKKYGVCEFSNGVYRIPVWLNA
jgi:hypothetical protein